MISFLKSGRERRNLQQSLLVGCKVQCKVRQRGAQFLPLRRLLLAVLSLRPTMRGHCRCSLSLCSYTWLPQLCHCLSRSGILHSHQRGPRTMYNQTLRSHAYEFKEGGWGPH